MKTFSTFALVTSFAAFAAPSHAHVFLQSGGATVGGSYRAVLAVPHGCKDSATTAITVKIPEGMVAVKPMPKPGWSIATKKGAYAKSYDFMHGMKASKGVQEITWTGRLDNEFYDEFVFTGFLPAELKTDAPLYLPTLQICETGSENWTEIAAAGQDPHALKSPAPMLRLAASSKPAMAAMAQTGDLMITAPWTRATPPGAKLAGGYLSVMNMGNTSDRLTGGSFGDGGRIEVHEMSMTDGVMKMRELGSGLEIKPGATVELKPGGYHLMLLNLAAPFKQGDKVKAQLTFEKAGKVEVEFDIAGIGASAPAAAGGVGHAH